MCILGLCQSEVSDANQHNEDMIFLENTMRKKEEVRKSVEEDSTRAG